MPRYDTVSFLSDYGRVDEFVGVVHSIIRSIAPEVRVIDITHDIAPYDVRSGGLALVRAANYLAPGVVVAVIDPTVGTPRRPIAVEIGGGSSVLVGPDNGVLAPVVQLCGGAGRAVEIVNPEYRFTTEPGTFDGRDVFAPAAAHLCNGVDLAELGPSIDPISLFPAMIPLTREDEGRLHSEVLWVDHYGNAQLNVDPDELEAFDGHVRLVMDDGSRVARRVSTFADLENNELGLIVDSYGLITIVLDKRSAAEELGLSTASAVTIEQFDETRPPSVITPVQLGQRRS
ncbi:MAG: SAM-dependent chlorinase/fluorinase [Actinomycetota bacterium]|nr:SAM-dependent chlorinase/fluorinase [Acidimicrobiia bacterium]